MTFPRLPGSPNRISPMLQISWQITVLRTNVREIYVEQRSYYHRRGCRRGFTIARVHSYGKGIADVGFMAADWESHAARPFWLSFNIGGSYTMRRSV